LPTAGRREGRLGAMESQRIDSGTTLLLTVEERAALARVLRVVEDEWWLDEVEQALLERLEPDEAVLTPA
jgi:hypothetical protein